MKKLKNKIKDLGLNFNKEITIFFIGFFLILSSFILSILFIKSSLVSIAFLICLLVFSFAYFYRYSLMEENNKSKSVGLFIEYFSYFRIYIFNGESVYTSLEKTLEFADNKIKPLVEGLIAEINEDKSINPFMRFAKNFDNKLIEEIMISIYEMVENGTNPNYINQFTTLFENFKMRINKENEEKRNEKFDRYTMSSLAGSGVIMIILVYGIINLIGEII